MTLRTILLCALIAAGCGELPTSTVVSPSFGCTSASCSNSNEMTRFGIWDLNLAGANTQGVTIAGNKAGPLLVRYGDETRLGVKDGRIIGYDADGRVALEGAALTDAEITLELDGTPTYVIHIDSVRETRYPLPPNDPLELYVMSWHEPGRPVSPDRPLCAELLSEEAEKDPLAGLFEMHYNETLVFEGDRYDVGDLSTRADGDTSWFNFGCAGHALAKLELTHQTLHATQRSPLAWKERQAALKMMTAAYCGDGQTFTKTGVHVMWKDPHGIDYPVTPTSIEARWDETGATCLGTPRLVDATDVFKYCDTVTHPLAPCADPDPTHHDGALRVTANYSF